MITYVLVNIRAGHINDIQVDASKMINEIFSIGVTLTGVTRLSDYEAVRLAESNPYFRESLSILGINIEEDQIWEIDKSRGVSKEIVKAFQDNAGIFFMRELNLLHGIHTHTAKHVGINRMPYKIAGFLADKMSRDSEVSSFKKSLSSFCELLDTKKATRLRSRHPRSFNTRKYSVDDVNNRLDELYLDAAANKFSGNTIRDVTSRTAVLELTYQPISEYLSEALSGDEICNGYVYYTRRGETAYFTHNHLVLSASIRHDDDKVGCVEIFEDGEATTLIPQQDFDMSGLYTTHQAAALSVGQDNVESALAKTVVQTRKDNDVLESTIESLRSDISKRDLSISKLQQDVIVFKNKIAKQEAIHLEKEKARIRESAPTKKVVDAINDTKVAVVGLVAIVGGAYTLYSYFSSE